jgi:hypothetical protein
MLIFILAALCACAGNRSSSVSAPPMPTATPAAPALDVGQLIRRLTTQDGCRDSTAEMRFSFTGEGGRREQLDFRLQRQYAPARTATLLTVTSPREESEKALLALERPGQMTEAFSYLAGLRRLARLTSSNTLNFRGARVHVQELLGLELGQYTPASPERVSQEGESLAKVEFTEKFDRQLAFPRLTGFFREDGQSPVRFALYNSRGELVKTIQVEEVKTIQGYRTLTRLAIEDHKESRQMHLETLSIKYDRALPDAIFSEDHLIKIVSEASRRLIQ